MWCGNEPATDAHHLFPRSKSPQLINDKNNLVKLGRKCHSYATNNQEVLTLFQWYFFLRPQPEQLTIEYIANQLKDKEILSPRDVTRYKSYLSGEYYFLNARYVETVADYNHILSTERKITKHKTDAELQADITPTGRAMHAYKRTLYAIEDMQKTLFTLILQYDKESKNAM